MSRTFTLVLRTHFEDALMHPHRYGSFSYYGFNVALKVEFSGRLFDDCGGLADEGTEGEPTECEPIDDIGEALSLPTDVEAPPYPQVLVRFHCRKSSKFLFLH